MTARYVGKPWYKYLLNSGRVALTGPEQTFARFTANPSRRPSAWSAWISKPPDFDQVMSVSLESDRRPGRAGLRAER
jgi:hypothetical protein